MYTPQVIDYIKAQFKKGKNEDQIRESLHKSGWKEFDIKDALIQVKMEKLDNGGEEALVFNSSNNKSKI